MNDQSHGSMPRAAKVGALSIERANCFRCEGNRRRLALLHFCPDTKVYNDETMTHVFGLDDDLDRLSFFHGDFVRVKRKAACPDGNGLRIVAGPGSANRACRRIACEYCKRTAENQNRFEFHKPGSMIGIVSRSRRKKFEN